MHLRSRRSRCLLNTHSAPFVCLSMKARARGLRASLVTYGNTIVLFAVWQKRPQINQQVICHEWISSLRCCAVQSHPPMQRFPEVYWCTCPCPCPCSISGLIHRQHPGTELYVLVCASVLLVHRIICGTCLPARKQGQNRIDSPLATHSPATVSQSAKSWRRAMYLRLPRSPTSAKSTLVYSQTRIRSWILTWLNDGST